MANKTLKAAQAAYNRNQQTKGGQKQAKKDRIKTKKKKEKTVGSSWDSVKEKAQTTGKKGEENRKNANVKTIAKNNTELAKKQTNSGAVKPVKSNWGEVSDKARNTKGKTTKFGKVAEGVIAAPVGSFLYHEAKNATDAAGWGSKQAYRAKDTSARNRTKTTTRNDRRNAGQSVIAQKQLDEHNRTKEKTKIYQTDKNGKIKTDKNGNPVLTEYGKGQKEYAKPFKKASKKLTKEQDKTLEHGAKALGLSDEKKFSIPDIPVVNKFLPSTEEQQKQTRKSQLKAAGLDKQSIKDSLTEIDNYAKEQGFTDDTLLDNGKTYGQYRKELEAGMYADRDSAIKAINENMDKEGVGKFSATDIYKGGNKALDELADYLIPYGGSAKASLKAAEGILKAGKGAKAGKALTTLGDDVVKGLSKGGKKYVREAVENGLKKGDNLGDILKDISKTVSKSNLKQNVKKELIANAIQDATLGTTIDALKGKQQGLKGDEFKKYMAENAVMNAAFGMPISMIAGRTGKAGKLAIAEDIATEANRATDLAKAGGNIADISNGKVVAQNAETAVDSMSREEAKAYYNLKEKANNGTIKPEEQAQFNQLQDKVKEIFRQTETVSNKVINLKTLKSGDLHDAETAVKFFERTGDTNKLKVAQKALESAKVATRNLNESLDNAMKTMTEKTGIDYKWVTGDEMRALGADEDSVVKGFTHFDENGKATVLINRESPQAWQTVVGHETMHLIKKSDETAFNDLGDALEKYAKELDEYDELEAVMRRNYPEFDAKSDDFREEMVSEMLGRYVFGEDDKFIKRLADENPTVLEKIVDYIKNLIKKAKNPELAEQFNKFVDSADEAIRAINKDEVAKNAKGAEGKKSVGGKGAVGADADMADLAVELKGKGFSNNEIQDLTGWYVPKDGEPRFRFSDKDYSIKQDVLDDFTKPLSASEIDALNKRADVLENKVRDVLEKENANSEKQWHVMSAIGRGYDEDTLLEILEYNAKKGHFDPTLSPELRSAFNEAHSVADMLIKGSSADKEVKLGELINHEELFKYYPKAKDVKVKLVDDLSADGVYDPEKNTISLKISPYKKSSSTVTKFVNKAQLEDNLLHEIQHAIQKAEGFASGSNAVYYEVVARNINSKIQKINDALLKKDVPFVSSYPANAAKQIEETLGKRTADKYLSLVELSKRLGYEVKGKDITAKFGQANDNYARTLGEMEARDAEKNRRLSNEELGKSVPKYADDEDALIASDFEKFKFSKEKPADAGAFNEEIKSLDPDYVKNIGTGAKFSKVAKPETLKFLDDQEKAGKTVEVYRAMVEIDGKLYPPMATKIKSGSGKAELQDANKLGEWVQADEHPELLDKDGKFVLRKDKGTPIHAAYNPYIHTSFSPLNDQFTSAYKRPNLVVVKGIVPESELTSGYKATGAKDAVGKTQWHSGVVAGQLPEAREVMLSRWFKPQEVVSDAEVAKTIKHTLGDTGIEIPYNVVTPSLRRELEKVGVPIGEGRGGAPKKIPSLESGKASKENVGYHAGDLGKAESMGNQTGGRGTGHFGTGTYFVGNKVKIDGYNARDGKPAPVETVNFDKYNLYKPHNTEDAYALHDFLRDVNDYFELVDSPKTERNFVRNIKRRTDDLDYKLWDAQDELESLNKSVKSMDDDSLLAAEVAEQRVYELREELYELGKDALGESRVGKLIGEEDPKQLSEKSANEILWDLQHPDDNGWYNNWERPLDKVSSFYNGLDLWAIRLNTSKDKLLDAMREAKRQSDSLPLGSDKRYTADSASTLLMKKLGYEGVDVRHTDLDNTTYGSVIYDLKDEDLARKKEIGTARFSKEARGKRDTTLDAEIKTLLKDEHLKSGAGKDFETDLRAVAKLVEEEKIDEAVTKVQEVVRKHMTVDEYETVGDVIDENVKSIIKSSPINISGLGDGTIAHKLENIGLSKADVPSAIQLRSVKGGRPLDRVYTELSDDRPDIFPPDASSEDKLKYIIESLTKEPDRARKPQDWIDGEYNDLAVSVLEKIADGVYADRKLATPKPEPKPEPKVEKPAKPKKKPAKPKEPEKTEVQKLHENEYVSDNVKTALKDIEEAGVNVEKAEKVAKRFNNLDKQIGAKTKHIENAKKSEKYATEAERAERVAELEDELATLKQKQAKAAGELEQLGKMKAVDDTKSAGEQIKELRGERKVNKELKNTENLTKTDNWIKDKWNSVRRLWEDSLIDVENTAKATGDMNLRNEILTAANRVRNSMSEANTWITKHRRSFDNKVGGKALDEIFNKELIDNEPKYADFQEYLIMKHVPARHAKGTDIYPEISPALAEKRVKELEEKYAVKDKDGNPVLDKDGKPVKSEIETWADDVYDYINDLQQYRVDSGMLSQEAADQFAKDYPFYVPTNRVNDESGQIDFFTGGLSNGIRSAKGGDNDVLDMYSQLYTATNKTIHAAEENQMLNLYFRAKGVTKEQLEDATLDDLEHAVIEAKVNKKTGSSTVTFFVDGTPVKLPCNHQLALGLREMDGLEFERLLKAAKVATLYGKPFKALVTDWNLAFGVRNGARDLQQALVNSKDTRFFASSTGAAAHAVAHEDSPFRKLYASMGGEQAQLVSYDAVAKQMGIERQGKVDAIHEKVQDIVDLQVKGKYVNPIHYVEAINGAIEMMPRMCEFIGTLRKDADKILRSQGSSLKKLRKEIIAEVDALKDAGKIGVSDVSAEVENRLAERIIDMVGKDSIDTAMRNANDITLNFGRSGVLGKALNMGFVPYLNPSIQGLSKLVRLFTEAGQEGGWKALASIGMKLGTFTIAPALLNEVLLKDNEDYQNLNTRDKDNAFFIPLDKFGEEWEGKFFKFPKPRENAVLAEPVEYGLRYFLDDTEYDYFDWDKLKMEGVPLWEKIPLTDEGKQSFRTALDNIGVINPATSNMLSPIWQTFHNKTWYGGNIESAYETAINEDENSDRYGKANVPVNKRYDSGTSAIAISLGQTKVAKELNLSPKKIDNILDSYTGMIYDLGISQFTEEAKTRGNWFNRTLASQFVKDSVFSNKLSTKAWEKMDGMTKKEQDAYKSKYMYDTYKYDDAQDLITSDKKLTAKEKMDAKRALQIKKNKLNRAAINGDPNDFTPLKDIAEHLGATKTLNHFLPDTGAKDSDTWVDYFKNYKKTKGYKGLTPAQKEKQSQKFLDVYNLGVKGQSKVGSDFHDSPSWGMTGVAAAQRYKQGKLSQKDAETIMQSCGVYESQTASYFKYADHGGNVSRYAVTKKNNNKAEDLANELGVSTKGDGSIWKNKYSKEKGIKGGVLSMSLATGKADFKDRAYYISNSGDANMLIKMNAARGYAEKYGHTTKQLIKLGKKADADGNTYLSNEEIESACNTIKGGKATSEEKAMGWVLLGGNPNKNPFGAIGNYSHDGDTGITMDDDGKSGGHGRRGRGRRGRGGGGGGSKKGTMPKTESGAIKGKVTDVFANSNGSKASTLNDAYRKKVRKLRKELR